MKERNRRMRSTEYKNKHTNFENKKRHDKEYYNSNSDKIKKSVKEYHYKRLKEDLTYRLLNSVRSRFQTALKKRRNSNGIKNIIGCTLPELLEHLQNTAINNGYVNFDINNYNTKMYHIDHIKPCYYFDFTKEDDVRACFHYTNMQILSASENLSKSNKLIV